MTSPRPTTRPPRHGGFPRAAPPTGVGYARTLRGPVGQPGRAGRARPRPDPSSPPFRLALGRFLGSSARLGEPLGDRRRPVTDLPSPEDLSLKGEVPRHRASGCPRRVDPPDRVPPYPPFGLVLISRAIRLRRLGLRVAKVADSLEEACGVRVSPATVPKMENGATAALELSRGARRNRSATSPWSMATRLASAPPGGSWVRCRSLRRVDAVGGTSSR